VICTLPSAHPHICNPHFTITPRCPVTITYDDIVSASLSSGLAVDVCVSSAVPALPSMSQMLRPEPSPIVQNSHASINILTTRNKSTLNAVRKSLHSTNYHQRRQSFQHHAGCSCSNQQPKQLWCVISWNWVDSVISSQKNVLSRTLQFTLQSSAIYACLVESIAATLGASLVQSMLDYANSIMYGMYASNMHKLQSAQKSLKLMRFCLLSAIFQQVNDLHTSTGFLFTSEYSSKSLHWPIRSWQPVSHSYLNDLLQLHSHHESWTLFFNPATSHTNFGWRAFSYSSSTTTKIFWSIQ